VHTRLGPTSEPKVPITQTTNIPHHPSQSQSQQPPHIPTQRKMVLRIRLARFGKKHSPFYNIVLTHARYISPNPQKQPQPKREKTPILTIPKEQHATRAPSKSSAPTTQSRNHRGPVTRTAGHGKTLNSTFHAHGTGWVLVHSRAIPRGGYSAWWGFSSRSIG
jgi:hypothetical protein